MWDKIKDIYSAFIEYFIIILLMILLVVSFLSPLIIFIPLATFININFLYGLFTFLISIPLTMAIFENNFE